MPNKETVHKLIDQLAREVHAFVKASEGLFPERWVPAAYIKTELDLNLVAVPMANNPQRGKKGWFFASLARILEERKLLEYRKEGNSRAYYRTR